MLQIPDFPFILRFLFVGGSTALLFFGLTFALVESLQIAAVWGSTLSCVVTICYNYLLHYHWTFASDSAHGLAMTRYLIMSAGGLLLNSLIMYLGTMQQTVHYMVVQFIAGLGLVCWSLSLSYFWVFRQR